MPGNQRCLLPLEKQQLSKSIYLVVSYPTLLSGQLL